MVFSTVAKRFLLGINCSQLSCHKVHEARILAGCTKVMFLHWSENLMLRKRILLFLMKKLEVKRDLQTNITINFLYYLINLNVMYSTANSSSCHFNPLKNVKFLELPYNEVALLSIKRIYLRCIDL